MDDGIPCYKAMAPSHLNFVILSKFGFYQYKYKSIKVLFKVGVFTNI